MDSERLELGDTQLSAENKFRIQTSLTRNSRLHSIRLPLSKWTDLTADSLCRLLDQDILQALWLDKAVFGDRALVNLCEAITKSRTLRILTLPNSEWNDETAPVLCTLLQHNHTLRALRLNKSEFSAHELISLCEVLTNNRTLMSLVLSETSWTPQSAAALLRLLHNTQLQVLQLREARFTPEHIISLCEALGENQKLQTLDLTETTWSDESVDKFCGYIRTDTTLAGLALRKAKFTPGDVVSLVSALSSNRTLRYLVFGYSTWGEGSLASLCEWLRLNHTMEVIDFSNSKFTNTGLEKIFSSLSTNTVLKNVQFYGSILTDIGAESLRCFLKKNSQLQDLWFGNSEFTDTGLADLMSSLSANNKIQHLSFDYSKLSDAAIPDLCKMLQHNNHIKRIEFDSATFTNAGVSALMRTLTKNKTLESLDIEEDLTDAVIADLCRFLDHNTTIQRLQGTSVTDDKLRWALQELVKLDNVQEASIDGKSMELKVTQIGEWDAIRITASDDWEKDPAFSGHYRTLAPLPDQQNPDMTDSSTAAGNQTTEPLSQKVTEQGDVYTVPVADQRWVKVQKHGDGSTAKTHISAWCPQDVLTTCNHLHDQRQTVEGSVEIDFNITEGSWGSPQLESWTQEEWVPVLTSLLASPGKVTGLCVKAHNLLPINGLLRAAQGMLTPRHLLTGGMTVCGGQVSEDVLLTFLDVTHTVSLHIHLSDIVIVLRGGRGLADVQELATLVQQKVAIDVQGRPGKVEHLTYVTPEGQVVHEDVDSEEERSGQQHKTRTIKVVVSERPWELEVLEPKYRRAYEIASRRGTQTVSKARVMVVGHYGAGKTNLVRCLLDKEFNSQHHTTIGIEADPGQAKIEITLTKGWTQHKEDTFESKMAKHLVNEANVQDPPSESDTPVLPIEQDTSSNVAQTTELEEINDRKLSSSARGLTKRSQRHHETSTASSMQIKEEQPSKLTNKGIPLNIMEMIAKEEERRKETMMKQTGESQELYFWDYAGQGIFYTTHQLFLTARSIYIVVLNLKEKMAATIPTYRKDLNGETVLDHSCPQTVQDYVQYWLSCIYTHVDSARRAAGMEATRWDPQVILALTHKDECSEEEVEEYKVDLEKFLHKKGYKFLIQDILTISNRNREYNDVKNMKEALEKLGKERNYEVPLSWYKLKEGIMREDKKSLTLDDIRCIANKEDLQDFDETSIQAALSFLHEVGDVVYFKDGPLSDFIVKDVQWLVDQFKKIISITADHKNQPGYTENAEHWKNLNDCGILHQKLLESVWPEEDTRTKLLSLMLRFCLVMPAPNFYMQRKEDDTPDTHYLVPCLLPAGIPPTELETDHVVRLCPNMGFLPVGLVSRLLASLSVEYKWRSDGQVYQDGGTFKPSKDHLGMITIRKRSVDNEQSTVIEAIEVSVHQENQPMGDSILKESFSVIAQALHNLPGKSDFGVWLCCKTCKQWNFICNLKESDDQSVCERSICERHGPPLKQSEHAHWFCENIEDEAQASESQTVSAKHLDAGSKDGSGEEQVDDESEDKMRLDVARILQLTDILCFINRVNEEELVEMGVPDRLKASKLIIKEIRTCPLWRIQGFLRAFPLGTQNLIKDLLGMHAVDSGTHIDASKSQVKVTTPVKTTVEEHRTIDPPGNMPKDMQCEPVCNDGAGQDRVQQITKHHKDSEGETDVQQQQSQDGTQLVVKWEEQKEEQEIRQIKEKEREVQDVAHKKEKDTRQEEGILGEEHDARQKKQKEREEQEDVQQQQSQDSSRLVIKWKEQEEEQEIRQGKGKRREDQDIEQAEGKELKEQYVRQVRVIEKEEQDIMEEEEDKGEKKDVRQDEEKGWEEQDIRPGGEWRKREDSLKEGSHQHKEQYSVTQDEDKQHKDNTKSNRRHDTKQQEMDEHQDDQSSSCNVDPLSRPQNTFSERFSEEGGVLQSPDSDVVVTVPPGAVPPGETVHVCVKIYTNLMDYSRWTDSECILGPIVECVNTRGETFQKHVTILIPLCITPKKSSDITVLYSIGDVFRDVKYDSNIHYEIKDNFLQVSTLHFTKFLVKRWRRSKVDISHVLLTVAAGSNSPKEVEMRLMAHVNCSTLKEFKADREWSFPEGMREIDSKLVSLPESNKTLKFPKILVELKVKDHCPWEVVYEDRKQASPKEVRHEMDGRHVLLRPKNVGSNPIREFFLKTLDTSEKLELLIEVTFKYEKVDGPFRHVFSIIYPKTDAPKHEADDVVSKGSPAQAEVRRRRGPYEKLTYDKMDTLIVDHKLTFYKRFKLTLDVMAELERASVITDDIKDECNQDHKSQRERIDVVLETVRAKGVLDFLNFCHVLCDPHIAQHHLVTEVMGLHIADIQQQREEMLQDEDT